jgi:hypothetical protein
LIAQQRCAPIVSGKTIGQYRGRRTDQGVADEDAVRDVFKGLYDQGYERWDHSAFLLYLEKLNAPVRLGSKADTPPQ